MGGDSEDGVQQAWRARLTHAEPMQAICWVLFCLFNSAGNSEMWCNGFAHSKETEAQDEVTCSSQGWSGARSWTRALVGTSMILLSVSFLGKLKKWTASPRGPGEKQNTRGVSTWLLGQSNRAHGRAFRKGPLCLRVEISRDYLKGFF